MTTNQRIVQVERPLGRLPAESDFRFESVELPPLNDGEVRIAVSHLSIDAFIRTTLDDGGMHDKSDLGNPVMALGVGQVEESSFAGLQVGDWVSGPLMAQSKAVLPGAFVQKIDSANVPVQTYLGLLGITTGFTAYFGMLRVAGVNEGDTVVVSGAAGAVGSVAAQLAKIKGARVIGIAGGPHKVDYLENTLGLDAGVDYKAGDVGAQLDKVAPDGIDVYFDNVGGELLDVVLDRIRTGARISICGAISQYSDFDNVYGPKLYLRLAERNSSMAGFTVNHYEAEYPQAYADILRWMEEGKLQLPEHVEQGLDQFPAALIKLFTGGHQGKILVAV